MVTKCKFVPELETERLILRELRESDAEDLRKWLGKDEVYTYWGRQANKGELNPELLFIDPRPHVKRRSSADFTWGITLKETGEVIGVLEIFDVKNSRYGMVGYRIAPWLWNCGICTEAMRQVVEFIFSETSMDRLEATADVRNVASNKILERCGFRHEGTIRHGKMVNNYCDYNIWGLIREDIDNA